MPVFFEPSVGPTRMIVPSASSRWKRSKWTPQTASSCSVIVAAKSSAADG